MAQEVSRWKDCGVGKRLIVRLGKQEKELGRFKKLEQKNAGLKKGNDLLKKWQGYLAEQHQNALA
jgi:transposase